MTRRGDGEAVTARPKIAIVGPVLPFRGGIAQHTTMLRRALAESADVYVMSFARQYPTWLFPGESDRDSAFEGHVEPGTDYAIDSVNPLSWHSGARRIIASQPDAVVIPWWTIYFAFPFGYLARRFRAAGVPVVFVCHNVIEHESAGWRRWLTKRVLRRASGFVVQTRIDEEGLRSLLGEVDVVRQAHPVYEHFPEPTGVLRPEHDLELLFFGFVRSYKGLDVLLEALALVDEELDVRLTVAGEPWHGSEPIEVQVDRLGIADRVQLDLRYLAEEQIAEYFGRAHAAVLPYRSATGSGVIAVAYNYDTPVIVTDVGGLPDVVVEGETGFVVPPEDPQALARAIERLASADLGAMGEAASRYKREQITWEAFASAVLDATGVPRA
jgi:glycosyltransferase involved in cell wall biosynthesis